MLPMVLNIALFSIQPGVMPFQMNFTAFVISYFALASFVCLAWVLLVQWDSLVRLVQNILRRLDSAFKVSPSGAERNSKIGDEPGPETMANELDSDGDSRRFRGVFYAARKSIWNHLQLLVGRGGRGVLETEPAGLASVVYD